jgi:hypothetical protein
MGKSVKSECVVEIDSKSLLNEIEWKEYGRAVVLERGQSCEYLPPEIPSTHLIT